MHSICKIRKIISRKLLNNKYGNKILMRLSYDLDKIRQDPEDSNVSANSRWWHREHLEFGEKSTEMSRRMCFSEHSCKLVCV
jgi:hypothetical protein